MRRGQLEISFQWIFVLIAGVSFMVIFFLLIKGCAQSGGDLNRGLSVRYASAAISGAAWQPEANGTFSFQQAIVTCPAGTLTLTAGESSAPLPLSPSFLPPVLSGNVRLLTRQVATRGEAPIVLGNVLYAIDDQTEYFLVNDAPDSARHIADLGSPRNMHAVDVGDLKAQRVPSTATAIVIIRYNAPVDALSEADLPQRAGQPVYGVSLNTVTQVAQFYELRGSAFVRTKAVDYAEEAFALGAIISGSAGSFNCSKSAFIARSRFITGIAQSRVSRFVGMPDMDASCLLPLQAALNGPAGNGGLSAINKLNDGEYLHALLDIGRGNAIGTNLMEQQQALYRNSKCPVIS